MLLSIIHLNSIVEQVNDLLLLPYLSLDLISTDLDHLLKQNNLEESASFTRNAIEKSGKDYDQISYMMDSIVFDQMTMIGSREALIRPWDPSLLNRSSSKGSYPYPSVKFSLGENFFFMSFDRFQREMVD